MVVPPHMARRGEAQYSGCHVCLWFCDERMFWFLVLLYPTNTVVSVYHQQPRTVFFLCRLIYSRMVLDVVAVEPGQYRR